VITVLILGCILLLPQRAGTHPRAALSAERNQSN